MITLDALHEEIKEIKSDVERILEILEEYELTEGAKKALAEARTASEDEYIPHEELRK